MKNNTYYWVHTDGLIHKHTPMYRNIDNKWVLNTFTGRDFISDDTLKRLYGKGCVLREVDLTEDTEALDPLHLSGFHMHYFVVDGSVLFGNEVFWYNDSASTLIVNTFKNHKKLVYK